MSHHRKNVGRFAVLAACFGWLVAMAPVGAEEEASVLVEKQNASAINTPELSPPANVETLPPPERPERAIQAKPQASNSAKRPFLRPAEPKRTTATARAEFTSAEEPVPTPERSTGEVVVRPAPPIEYDTDRDARRMYHESGQVELVMVTQDPADGCLYEIPLCIPACCTGEPIVSSGRGIFGRGVVEYCWSCGFRAIVKFRHILGDVKVEYEGD